MQIHFDGQKHRAGGFWQERLEELGVELDEDCPWKLTLSEKGLVLTCADESLKSLELWLNFIPIWRYYQHQGTKALSTPLAKAIRGKHSGSENWTVVDGSCGVGDDSLLLLSFGFKVLAFERHPILALMLEEAFERAKEDAHLGEVITNNFKLTCADFCDEFHRLSEEEQYPQVFYFDPMYDQDLKEAKSRKADPKKSMQILSRLLGPDSKSHETLEKAMNLPFKRIVVKRSLKALELMPGKTGSVLGKSTRYDIYPQRK